MSLLVYQRERFARVVEAIDELVGALEQFDPWNGQIPDLTPPAVKPVALGGRKPGTKWGGGPVACRWCPRDFKNPGAARHHERQAHPAEFAAAENLVLRLQAGGQTPGRYPCKREGCAESFDSPRALAGHVGGHTNNDRRPARDADIAAKIAEIRGAATPEPAPEPEPVVEDPAERRRRAPAVMVPSGLPRQPLDVDRGRRAAFADLDEETYAG